MATDFTTQIMSLLLSKTIHLEHFTFVLINITKVLPTCTFMSVHTVPQPFTRCFFFKVRFKKSDNEVNKELEHLSLPCKSKQVTECFSHLTLITSVTHSLPKHPLPKIHKKQKETLFIGVNYLPIKRIYTANC